MPLWAVIFKIWKDVPIYHRLAPRSRDVTSCGRQVGLYRPLFPMKHAQKIGRPCRGCFPK